MRLIIIFTVSCLWAVAAEAFININLSVPDWVCDGKPAFYESDKMFYKDNKFPVTGFCDGWKGSHKIITLEFLNGLKNGEMKLYDNDGAMVFVGSYLNGMEHGNSRFYSKSGKVAFEAHHENGFLEGTVKMFYPDGSLYAMYSVNGGKLDGVRKTYFPDGVLGLEENWSEGTRNGKSIRYYSNGEKAVESVYENGVYKEGHCTDKNKKEYQISHESDLSKVEVICEQEKGVSLVIDPVINIAGFFR